MSENENEVGPEELLSNNNNVDNNGSYDNDSSIPELNVEEASTDGELNDNNEINESNEHENKDNNDNENEQHDVQTSLPQFYQAKSNNEPQTPTKTPVTDSDSTLNSASNLDDDNDDDDDSLPSRNHSRQSSVQLQGFSPSPAPGTPSSLRSPSGVKSLDQRFKTRLNSPTSQSPQQQQQPQHRSASLSTFSNHLKTASQISDINDLSENIASSPWDPIRWSKLRKLSSQLYSEEAISKYGGPTCVLPFAMIAIGTDRGYVLIFDYHQELKNVLGTKLNLSELGTVTSLAASADQTYVGVGYSRGHITTWGLNKPNSPNLHISPINSKFVGDPQKDGHLEHTPVIHLGFSGKRHSALISGDVKGMVFSHNAVRSFMGRIIKTRKMLGKYPQNSPHVRRKPASILACAAAPLGNEIQPLDDIGLVAVMTPYMLAIISTMPKPQTEFKVSKCKDASLAMGLSACLAWFPALKGVNSSIPKIAYCWSNVLTIMEIQSSKNFATESVNLKFSTDKRFVGDEAIVSVHWINRHIIGVVTITQRLLIINEATMDVCEQIDLINKHIMHHDYFSSQLHNLVVQNVNERHQPTVVADAYFNTVRAFKGRVFLIGKYEFVVGSLSNWADRLLDIMESGDYVRAIQLATSYYVGHEDMVTIGLPANNYERHELVKKNLSDMIFSSLRYSFRQGANPESNIVKQLTDASLTALVAMNSVQDMLGDIFEFYENSGDDGDGGFKNLFFESLVPFIYDNDITMLPPNVFKSLVQTYAESPDLIDQLETLVCNLDTQTLDLNFALNLCKQYRLYDTEIYIWNQTMHDFVTPLEEFVSLIDQTRAADFNDREQLRQHADDVFPYLSYILTSRVYPTGAYMANPAVSFKAKSDIYYYLFSGAYAQPENSYPHLSSILTFDCSGFFAALNEAFEDTFLNDKEEEGEENNLPVGVEEHNDKIAFGRSMNRQFVINSLLDLYAEKDLKNQNERIFLNIFIARNYPKYSQFLMLPGNVLSKVLEELCYNDDALLMEDCELAIESLLSKYKPPDLERLIGILYEVGLYKVLQFVFRAEKRYTKLLEVTLKLYNNEKSTFNNYRLLDVLAECWNQVKTFKERASIEQQVVENFEAFVIVGSERFVTLISNHAPQLHEQVFKLDQRPDLQYYYLKKLFAIVKKNGTTKLPSLKARHLYISLLIQRGETETIRALLTTVLTNVEDVDLPNIVDDLIETRSVDVLAMLLERRERYSEAMIYIVDHLLYLDETYSERKDSEKEVDDLEHELSRYVYIAMDICKTAEDTVEKVEDEGKDIMEVEENLGEQVWAKLIDTLVDMARTKDENDDENNNEGNNSRHGEFRRQLLQQTLSTLLEHTGRFVSNVQHNSTIIRIFRSVISPQAEKSRTIGAVRPILNDLFTAYRYQHTMLTVARQLLDRETYDSLLELVSARLCGWKISRSGECEGCGHRIIGVGVDAEWLYEKWQQWYKNKAEKSIIKKSSAASMISSSSTSTKKRISSKAKGKRPITDELQAEVDRSEDVNMLVVFKCEHTYHLGCLKNLGGHTKDLQCIICQ